MTETKHVYVLSVENAEGIVLTRPSTARSTIVSAFALCMAHVKPKDPIPWKIAVQSSHLSDAEIKTCIAAFDAQIEPFLHGEVACGDATAMLNDLQMFLAEEAQSDDG